MNPIRPAERPPEKPILTFRPGLRITDTCLQVGSQHFALAGLSGVHSRQGGHDPLTRRCAAMLAGGIVLTGLFAPVMRPAGLAGAVAVLCGLALLTVVSARRRPPRMELWADYRGLPTKLLVSDDVWLMGGVERYLRRALSDLSRLPRRAPRPPATSGVKHPSQMHPSQMVPVPAGR
ncbi:hypothetical protein Cs7R123_28770 [Catellatospora sp. TT07R-123]|uniref:DUF6232 family protein n=1 Tax=Catellatospora sp. TT07R-123 TaxID=2733863 RepID=UPI001B1AEC75|nr:DUF6232 family protein [Catellatospora sp. TT07R-123]GHJ45535.1 hypothetical protein Cs7R123_28770 [Catellatospora sp. TT07R-123]